MLDTYYARVCWNSEGWEFPTGEAAKLETNTYVASDKFGHEEWLFDYAWNLDGGYHYSFLQAVNQSFKKMSGKSMTVLLWSIDDQGRRVQIGEIRECQVLTEVQSSTAFVRHEKLGRLKSMREDVAAVNGILSSLTIKGLFNIRFKKSNATRYEKPYPIVKKSDKLAKLKRYSLVEALPSVVSTEWNRRIHEASVLPLVDTYVRSGSASMIVARHHDAIQKELCSLLKKEYGNSRVASEVAWVDLTVGDGERKMLIEIKPYFSARQSIREALGQILEYAFYAKTPRAASTELFIVAPGPADEDICTYVSLLRDTFRIPVRYVQFSIGTSLPAALARPNLSKNGAR